MRTARYKNDARGAALEALCRVDNDAAYSSAALNAKLNALNTQDRALASRLMYGTLQKRIYLDYCISFVSGKNAEKFDVPVKNALRLGAYQILFCEKIPAHAAINEAVNAVKLCGFTSAAGLVNAVLRKLINADVELPGDELDRLSVEHSLPLWLVYHLRKSYKTENIKDILCGLDSEPAVYLRVNNTKISPDELIVELEKNGIFAKKSCVENALVTERITSINSCKAGRRGWERPS